jgi:lactate dehydrogenase-like 2-hydroxyacid dehydrogenase
MSEGAARPRILISLPLTPEAEARARRDFDVWIAERPMRFDDIATRATEQQSQGLVVSLMTRFGADEIARLPASVRVLATTSVGYDHIDLAAASARGIVVTNTPDVLTDATADTTLLLLLGACRRAREHVLNMEGGWKQRNGFAENLGWDVTGRTLGIVGMGRIGRAVADRARGFRMPILYHNRNRLPPDLEAGARFFADLNDMLPQCQVLSLNLPGGQGVLMTTDRFARLPAGAIFINSARGSLVDEDALLAALDSGRLAAAGLDVFQSEPNYNLRLRDCPRVFLLPHIGSATIETRNEMGRVALDNVAAVLAGRSAPNALTS